MFSRPAALGAAVLWVAAVSAAAQPAPTTRPAVLPGVGRVLFLGDSITAAGGYVDYVDAYLTTHFPDRRIELLDLGLSSETTSSLSEPEHPFPRPDVHERLDRTLKRLRAADWKPDLVVACYGMNDGIYSPLTDERFDRYQDGVRRLVDRVRADGIAITLMNSPPFDPRPARAKGQTQPPGRPEYGYTKPYERYDEVLARYADWLLDQRQRGWSVIDLHGPLKDAERAARRLDPAFALAGDGIHPGPLGHELIARQLLRAWHVEPGDGLFDAPAGGDPSGDLLKLVARRRKMLSDAWHAHIGHGKPDTGKGLPLDEARKQAAALDAQIRQAAADMARVSAAKARDITLTDEALVVALSPDGRRLAVGGTHPKVQLLDADTGKVLAEYRHNRHACTRLQFSADGSVLFCRSWNGLFFGNMQFDAWRLADGRQSVPHPKEGDKPREDDPTYWSGEGDLSPDGTKLVLGGGFVDGLYVVNLADGKITPLPAKGHVDELAFSPDGSRLASIVGTQITVTDTRDSKTTATYPAPREDRRLVGFTPAGQLFAWASQESFRLTDPATEQAIIDLPGVEGDDAWTFARNGRWLVTGGGTVAVWDWATGIRLGELPPTAKTAVGVSSSASGHRLAAADGTKAIRIWEIGPQ